MNFPALFLKPGKFYYTLVSLLKSPMPIPTKLESTKNSRMGVLIIVATAEETQVALAVTIEPTSVIILANVTSVKISTSVN